ncbi:MAG: 30S ribosomal protein S4 [Patescibacteria group bacterium]
MKIGPRYKIVRRLGAPVFEKTQTQKYAMRAMRKTPKRGRAKTDYGLGMMEKQKARMTYGVTSTQFGKYVKKAMARKGNSVDLLISILESRLDNAVLKAGFSSVRAQARQMVSHGHFLVNGKALNVPSYQVSVGDVISIREGSKKKVLFAGIEEKLKTAKVPAWIKVNPEKKEAVIDGIPRAELTELLFNPASVLEFYSR